MCKGTKLVGTTWKIIQLFMQNKICGFMEIELQEKSMAKRQEKRKVLGIHISKDLNYCFVEHSGLEPLTSTLPVSRSSQMS